MEDGDFEDANIVVEGPVKKISTIPYNPEPEREQVRGWLAKGLLLLVASEALAFVILALTSCAPLDDIKELVGLILSPTIAFASAATGFYFASNK